jgi:hypothetical protein
MTRRLTVYAGLLLPIVAVIVGIALGRVIEAIAVAAVLLAVWSWARRLLLSPGDPTPGPDRNPWA